METLGFLGFIFKMTNEVILPICFWFIVLCIPVVVYKKIKGKPVKKILFWMSLAALFSAGFILLANLTAPSCCLDGVTIENRPVISDLEY